MVKYYLHSFLAIVLASSLSTAFALEYPIGKPQEKAGMEIAAVYLQPTRMDPEHMMLAADKADIHLEADIKALAHNPNGFAEGAWIPYLLVKYHLKKVDSTFESSGDFHAMVASDGPHYGDNIKLAGPGKYQLTYTILPPSMVPGAHFGRHIDKETGVGPWFKPFEVNFEFTYAGIGKKGGY